MHACMHACMHANVLHACMHAHTRTPQRIIEVIEMHRGKDYAN